MSIFVILLSASLVAELVGEFDRLERSWREYGEERMREGGGTSRWTDFNL
jgi:hypothetical protein